MNKNEYLDRLSKLLADISYEEHEEALSYYREYIEDAGLENEQHVIEELGTPEHLAQEIREGLSKKGEADTGSNEGNNISVYSGSSYNNSAYSSNYNNNSNSHNHAPDGKQGKDTSNTVLIVILVILTSPIWFSAVCTVISAVFACIVGVGAAGLVCIVTGIALIIAGISALFSITVFSVSGTLVGAALIGAGFIVLALGILFIVLTVWLCGWALPTLVRFISQTVSRISHKKKEAQV